jgi:hypothetical protein
MIKLKYIIVAMVVVLPSTYTYASECSDPKVREIALQIVAERTNEVITDAATKQLFGVQIGINMMLNPPLAKDLMNILILNEPDYKMDHIVTISKGVCKANFSASNLKFNLNQDVIKSEGIKSNDLETFNTLVSNINDNMDRSTSSEEITMTEYTVETTDDGEYLVTVSDLSPIDKDFENLRSTLDSDEYEKAIETFKKNRVVTPDSQTYHPPGSPGYDPKKDAVYQLQHGCSGSAASNTRRDPNCANRNPDGSLNLQ